MRGQHPGFPQPQSRQQSGYNDMQSLQHQLLVKQMQELQRQQLWQSGEELKQHNLMRQLPAGARQTLPSQLSSVNGELSNFTWQGEYAGNNLKVLNSSQMAMSGNMNLPQHSGHSMHEFSNGFAVSQEQAQPLQPFGFVPQHLDQSLYGLPVSGNRGWSNQYSQLHGFSQRQDISEAMPKGGGNLTFSSTERNQNVCEKQQQQQNLSSLDSPVACRQDFPEKKLFGQSSSDSTKNGMSTKLEQANPFGRSAHLKEFSARQESYREGNYQERPSHVPTSSSVRLDPTEQKILFSSDDDSNWDILGMGINMGAGSFSNGNSLDGNSFPSFQGGSWSALMQSAVAEVSSNDAGLKEEWSGLSLQKTDIISGKNTLSLGDTAKPQTNWLSNSLPGPNSSALGSVSSFQNGNANMNDKKITGFQQPSLPTFQQASAKIASDHSKSGQDITHYKSAQQSLHFSPPGLRATLTQQRNAPPCSSDILLSSKGDGWVSKDLPSSCVKAPFEVSGPGSSMQQGQMNDSLGAIYGDKNQGNNNWGIGPNRAVSSIPNSIDELEVMNSKLSSSQIQIALGSSSKSSPRNYESNEHHYNQGKLLVVDSFQSTTGKENVGNDPLLSNKRYHGWDSVPSNVDKVSSDTYEQVRGSQKEQSNDNSHLSAQSHPDSSDSGGVARAGADSYPYVHGNQSFHGHAGHKGSIPRKFQYHPMGNIGFISEDNDPRKKLMYALEQGQMPIGSSKTYKGYLQQASTSGAMEMDKVGTKDAERTARDPNLANSIHDFQMPPFVAGPSVVSPQGKGTGQTSQNMLELFNTVDRPRASDSARNFADQILLPQGNEHKVSDGHTSNPQYNQIPNQGFRLQLGPPFERQSGSNNSMCFSPQSVSENNAQTQYPDGEETNNAWSNSTVPNQSMHLPNDATRTDEFDGQPVVTRKVSKETSESCIQDKYLGGVPGSQSYSQNQLQAQQNFDMSSNVPNDRLGHSQYGVHNNSKTGSKHQQSGNSHIDNMIDGSTQNTLSDLSAGSVAFRLASPQDVHSSLVSQSGSAMPLSCSSNFESNVRSSTQQVPDSQVSMQHSPAQQIGFSGNFPQLRSSFSSQCLSNSFHQQSMISSLQPVNANSFRIPSWIPAKPDIQDNVNCRSSSTGACVNSEHQISAEERPDQDNSIMQFPTENVSSHGQELSGNRNPDRTLPMASYSGKMDQKESENYGQGLLDNLQRAHHVSNNDHGFVFRQPDSQNRSYSLLQQVQALKALEVDQTSRLGKRFKGCDVSMESRFTGKISQNLKTMDGYGAEVRIPGSQADNELSAVVHRGSFPSNSRMLSFSSTAIEDQIQTKITEDPGPEVSCQDLSSSKPSDSFNSGQSIGVVSTFSLVKSIEDLQAKSQMTPPWVDQHGMHTSSDASPVHDERGSLHLNVEVASEHHLNSQISESSCSFNDRQSTSISISIDPLMLVNKLPAEVLDHNFDNRPKRKREELLPWHHEITEGSNWLQSIRMADMNWARATNRLNEKVEDESFFDYGPSMFQSRRRLTLTTHLMQQLLPAVPAAVFTERAATGYELIMFLVAKLGLGDACSLLSSLANGVGASTAAKKGKLGRFQDFERNGDEHFLKVMENFAGRTRKLESDLLRFEKKASVLDVRVECQDLERFSIINRFAKFHGRNQTEGVDGSSTSESSRKVYPQRFVTAISMPGNPPEGLVCLSL